VRLRTLTEAECYARCYGGRHDERVSLVEQPLLAERRRRSAEAADEPEEPEKREAA